MPERNALPALVPAASRLSQLPTTAGCVCYIAREDLIHRGHYSVTVYGLPPTPEIVLEVTDGKITRAASFVSRLKDPTVDRREGLSLVDLGRRVFPGSNINAALGPGGEGLQRTRLRTCR